MNGYDTSEGYHIGPLDDRDEAHPEYTIDPILSYDDNHGGDHPSRHRGLNPDGSYERRIPTEEAAYNPETEVSL